MELKMTQWLFIYNPHLILDDIFVSFSFFVFIAWNDVFIMRHIQQKYMILNSYSAQAPMNFKYPNWMSTEYYSIDRKDRWSMNCVKRHLRKIRYPLRIFILNFRFLVSISLLLTVHAVNSVQFLFYAMFSEDRPAAPTASSNHKIGVVVPSNSNSVSPAIGWGIQHRKTNRKMGALNANVQPPPIRACILHVSQ